MNPNELPTPDNRRLVSSDWLASVELHVCRWAFVYVLISYGAFVVCNLLWLHWKWANGATVYDVAMIVIGLFWLGVIGLSKLLLFMANT